jgi:hypothetical protein
VKDKQKKPSAKAHTPKYAGGTYGYVLDGPMKQVSPPGTPQSNAVRRMPAEGL